MRFQDAFRPGSQLAEGWHAVRVAPMAMLGGAVLVGFLQHAPSVVTQLRGAVDPSEVDPATALATTVVSLVLAALGWVLRCWLAPGWMRAQVAALRGREDPALLVSGGDVFGHFLGWSMLSGAIVSAVLAVGLLAGVVVAATVMGGLSAALGGGGNIPFGVVAGGVAALVVGGVLGAWVGLGMALGEHAVVLEGLGPRAALARSWALVDGHRLELFLFLLVNQLVTLLGLAACGVGVIPAWAVTATAQTRAYMLLVGIPVTSPSVAVS